MPLTQAIGNRTYNYSHCIGGLTAFSGPVDIALREKGVVYASCRSSEPGSRPLPGQCWVKWDIEEDAEILRAKSELGGDQQLIWPSGIALDADGNVYLADEWLNRISVFSNDGAFLHNWGKPGRGPGELDGPAGIRFDSQGYLYISESRNNRIQKFTKDGKIIALQEGWDEVPGGLNMPYGLHIDCDDSVYVADWGNDRVLKFNSNGQFLRQFGKPGKGTGELTRPSGVAVDEDGDVYVADWGNNRVVIFDSQGEAVTALYGDARELSKLGQRYVDVNPNMAKARRRADTSKEWPFFRPVAISIDDQNRIMVIESIPGRIQVYHKDKNYQDPQFNL
jgi:tripartite motif-containing protein 71